MKRVFGWVLLGAIVSTVTAGESKKADGVSPKAIAVLKKAEAALRNVKAATYSASYRGTNWIATRVPNVEGIATIGTRSKWDIDPFFCDVKITENGSDDTVSFAAGSNGDTFFLIDTKTRTVYEDMDPLVLGSQSRNIQRVLAREFSMPDPFADAYKAGTVQMKDEAKINGEPCDVVYVEGKEPPALTYYVAKKDHLPRRIIRTYKNAAGEAGNTELTISHLKVNPAFARDPFAVIVPHGFKKTDDFAP